MLELPVTTGRSHLPPPVFLDHPDDVSYLHWCPRFYARGLTLSNQRFCDFRPPNGQRISGERRAEGDERVRCMRVLGGRQVHSSTRRLSAAAKRPRTAEPSRHAQEARRAQTRTRTARLAPMREGCAQQRRPLEPRPWNNKAAPTRQTPRRPSASPEKRSSVASRSEAPSRLRHDTATIVTHQCNSSSTARHASTSRPWIHDRPRYASFRPPNGQRISGERRAEGDERVRCMRVLGDAFSRHAERRPAQRLTLSNCP